MKSFASQLLTCLTIAALLILPSVVTVFAAPPSPLTPELAAKRENYRKQKEQQHITQDQRAAAAEALKAERLRVHQARQAVKQGKKHAPVAADTK